MPDTNALVIVTGSSGLIGSAVCRALAADGYQVAGFDRPGAPEPPSGIRAVPCDVTSDESVAQAVRTVREEFGRPLASVIHLAAYYDFSGEPSPQYQRVTVDGTARLLRQVMPLRPGQFVFSSTMLVHKPCEPGQHIDEDWPIEPKWDYPQSKAETERTILARKDEVPVVLLRIAGVYTDRCESIPLAHQMQRIYERRITSKVFPGDTSRGQSFVHLDDVVDAFRAAVDRRQLLSREATVLVGEPDAVSYDELQRRFAAEIHGEPDWETVQIPKAVAKAGAWLQDTVPGVEEPFIKPWMIDLSDDHYALDVSRARVLLGWSPAHRLGDTVPSMASDLLADPPRFYRRNKLTGEPPDRAAVASRAAARRET